MQQLLADQLGHILKINYTPKRIISLVPSQTELLFDLGLEKQLVGITKFCEHPKSIFKSKEKIGGTKQLNFTKIEALRPDLIIANKEENVKEQVEYLKKKYPVYVSQVSNLEEAKKMIHSIGIITRTIEKAEDIILRITNSFATIPTNTKQDVLYLIWKEPYMTIGGDTFISDMLDKAGFRNVFCNSNRYPSISLAAIQKLEVDFVFLSSEPFPFKEKHIEEIQKICPKSIILLVKGDLFSWYGSRLLKMPDYFRKLNG